MTGPGDLTQTSFAADRARRTVQVDRWLAGLLGAEPGVALVAVGGYGRRELLPRSDLDVLLLHGGRDDIAGLADRIWYPVWDSGAELDHAVRTVPQARRVARGDLKVALGLLSARHVAGEQDLTERLRAGALEDWRSAAPTRLAELHAACDERARTFGELAFLLEPDLKEARGGLRDVHAIQAVAAAWVAPAPGPRVRTAYEQILDARHALHEITGRRLDRLVLEEQDEVARALGLLDGDVLLRMLAGAARTVAYAADHAFRQADRLRAARGGCAAAWPSAARWRTAWWNRTARWCWPGRPTRPETRCWCCGPPRRPRRPGCRWRRARWTRLTECPPLPVPWPAAARDALLALLGAGQAAVSVWEALDTEGLVTALIPDWERVRNRPQRNPLHTFTVDRHLAEAAAHAAALTREVARPDLLLLAALLHDIGKGWPGDHSVTGEVVARDVARRMGLPEPDVELIAAAVRHHLLLPMVATRRDLDDPVTVKQVAAPVPSRALLELLHALAIADGLATGPAAWNDWKADPGRRPGPAGGGGAGRRADAAPAPLRPDQLALAADGGPAATVRGSEVTVVAPDRPGLLWRAAGVLASPPADGPQRQRDLGRRHRGHRLRRRAPVRGSARPDAGGRRTCAGCCRAGWTWRTGWNAGPGPRPPRHRCPRAQGHPGRRGLGNGHRGGGARARRARAAVAGRPGAGRMRPQRAGGPGRDAGRRGRGRVLRDRGGRRAADRPGAAPRHRAVCPGRAGRLTPRFAAAGRFCTTRPGRSVAWVGVRDPF